VKKDGDPTLAGDRLHERGKSCFNDHRCDTALADFDRLRARATSASASRRAGRLQDQDDNEHSQPMRVH